MYIEEFEPTLTLGEKFERLAKGLSKVCDCAYGLLEDKKLQKGEKENLIDIVAGIKGAKKAVDELMAKHSGVSKKDREEIDEKADAFVDGLKIGR